MTDPIRVTRAYMPDFEEYIGEIRDLFDSAWITNMGEKHEKLEKMLAEYLGCTSVSLMCNGHMALELAIQALGLAGEVITTPYTFASTTHAIVRNGLTPVFCDIREDDCTMDPERIEALITPRTSAILPVHVYGCPCDVRAIEQIASAHNLKVLYDAAHAFGVRLRDGEHSVGIGCFGDASVFSFHATKVFHTIEGGAVSFRNPLLGLSLYHLKNFGIMGPEDVDAAGANAKMNEFQAAMGICNLRHIGEAIERRRAVWEYYREALDGVRGLRLPEIRGDVEYNYAYFPVRIGDGFGCGRDEASERLASEGIFARKYFYPLTSDFACYRPGGTNPLDPGDTPAARRAAETVLTLPLYPELSRGEAERVVRALLRAQGV